jgi:hypothetical protein
VAQRVEQGGGEDGIAHLAESDDEYVHKSLDCWVAKIVNKVKSGK